MSMVSYRYRFSSKCCLSAIKGNRKLLNGTKILFFEKALNVANAVVDVCFHKWHKSSIDYYHLLQHLVTMETEHRHVDRPNMEVTVASAALVPSALLWINLLLSIDFIYRFLIYEKLFNYLIVKEMVYTHSHKYNWANQ